MNPGKTEWRRMVFTAWAVFAVSFLFARLHRRATRTAVAGRLG